MFTNRFSDQFPQHLPLQPDQAAAAPLPQTSVLPFVTLENIYQSAAARAARDHELDRLFNPDYYGDHGSGI